MFKKVFLICFVVAMIWLILTLPGARAQTNPPPGIMVQLIEAQILGNGWPDGTIVGLMIDNPLNGPGIDYMDTQLSAPAPWDPQQTVVTFNCGDEFALQPGQIVTLSGDGVTKVITIADLTVTTIDPTTDLVVGSAPASSDVFINIQSPDFVSRHEIADGAGNWSADFATPGDEDWESATFDILPETRGGVCLNDPDGDATCVTWQLPSFIVHNVGDADAVDCFNWLPGLTTLTIDNPATPQNPDYNESRTITTTDYWWFRFDLKEVFDIRPGYLVTVSSGQASKTHTVTELAMRQADLETGLIAGVASPGSVHLQVWQPELLLDLPVTTGSWSTVAANMVLGTEGEALQTDADGDSTRVSLDMPYNLQIVHGDYPNHPEYISIPMWPGQRPWPTPVPFTFYLTIDNDNDPGNGVLYSASQEVTTTAYHVSFELQGIFDLQRGHRVTVTDGTITKKHIVIEELAITTVDPLHDTISGTADPTAEVEVEACDSTQCARFKEYSDSSGYWSFDFGGEGFDIRPGTGGNARQADPDGDTTQVNWELAVDTDGDGVADDTDNAPLIYNPDQLDLDGDGVGDVADPCPSDLADSCNPAGSAAMSIGVDGGGVTTPDGRVAVEVPPGALNSEISISVTDVGSGYTLTTDQGEATALFGAEIGPPGLVFNMPVTLIFAWPDADNDGLVDDTLTQESDLLISQDGVIITGRCVEDVGCHPNENTFTVQVLSLSEFAPVTLNNAAPVVNAGDDASLNEGDTLSREVIFDDPDSSEWSIIVDYGDGVSENLTPGVNSFVITHPYADNGSYPVTITVDDQTGGIGSDSFNVAVANVVPVVTEVTTPYEPTQLGVPVTVSASFNDPAGPGDKPYICTTNYGDGAGDLLGQISENSCIGPEHSYSAPGVYVVSITVTDKDGASGSAQAPEFMVIYDPDGGFVTGGGWIDSPAGAFVANPNLSGKATFGFVAKYQKGANIPSGETEFQFKVADLNFHSTSYQWLVVAGPKAQFKGDGAINGAGDYGFMLTAVDEKLTPSTDVDLFRIKIWAKESDDIIYDNQLESGDDADPTTAISGGSIVIHKAK